MPEEKVGFGFEFGIKGDKEVKRSLEDIIRLMGNAGNAAGAISSILGKGFGLLEFGAAAAPIGLAAAAMATFAYKSAEAGESLRRTRFEIDRMSRVPAQGMTDSDLSANESSVVEQFKNLGLEAGNTFQLSFMDRLKSFGRGAYAVNWDVQASIANLFGANMQSYEQSSPEAIDAMNRVSMDQKVSTDRTKQSEATQQAMAKIAQNQARDLNLLGNQKYSPSGVYSVVNESSLPQDPRSKSVRDLVRQQTMESWGIKDGGSFQGGANDKVQVGILPESFAGQMHKMDISEDADLARVGVIGKQRTFDEKQLDAMRSAPVPLIPGTNMQDAAKRAADILELETKISSEKQEQLNLTTSILDIEQSRREIQRNFVSSQNNGTWRAVGAGGHGAFDGPGGARILEFLGMIKGGNSRVTGAASGHGMGAGMGDLKHLDVLKSIDKNIGKLGTPTLSN